MSSRHPRGEREFADISIVMFDAAYPPPVLGGKEKQAQLLTEALIRRGAKVAVLSFRLHGIDGETPINPPYVTRFDKSLLGIAGLLLTLFRLRRRFTVLHVHTPSRIGILVASLGQLLGYRVVFKLPNEGLVNATRGLASRMRLFLARRVHTIVCLESDSARKLLAAGVDECRIFLADNGVDLQGTAGFDLKALAPSRYQDGKLFEFLFVGRLVPQKRCADAIEAFRLSRLNDSGAILRIAGDGPLRGVLERYASDAGLRQSVIFTGHVRHPIDLMMRANCLLLCSEKEGMPNVVLEAMMVGLPVIATKVGAVERMLGGCAGCALFEVGDVRALSSLMREIMHDRPRALEYGRALMLESRRRFDIDSVAESYAARYRQQIG